MINEARRTHEIKSRTAIAKATFSKKQTSINKLDLNLSNKTAQCYIWSIAII
jgi:hypothetical protein